jgi:hypothetical protein
LKGQDPLLSAKYNPENVDPMLAEHAAALAGSSDYPEFINLSNEASLTCEDDTYTFSIPGEFIEDGYTYQIGIGTREETDSRHTLPFCLFCGKMSEKRCCYGIFHWRGTSSRDA